MSYSDLSYFKKVENISFLLMKDQGNLHSWKNGMLGDKKAK